MQPFSADVKDEILDNMNSRAKCDACIFGMLIFCKGLTDDALRLITENHRTAEFFNVNISRIIGHELEFSHVSRGDKTFYNIDISDGQDMLRLFDYFHIQSQPLVQRLTEYNMPKKKLLHAAVAGAFLVCGSVNDPNKPSHLEFVMPTVDLCNDIGITLIEECGVTAKHTTRGKSEVVYIKDSENIQDVLTYMGAPMSALKHITIKVDKEGNNRINRSINCASANIKKSTDAAARQIKAINILKESGEFDDLPHELISAANARLENPDMSLSELCEELEGVTKSSLNRRLNKLIELAHLT